MTHWPHDRGLASSTDVWQISAPPYGALMAQKRLLYVYVKKVKEAGFV